MKKMILGVGFLFTMFFATGMIFADTTNFVGPLGGLWDVPENWSNGLPWDEATLLGNGKGCVVDNLTLGECNTFDIDGFFSYLNFRGTGNFKNFNLTDYAYSNVGYNAVGCSSRVFVNYLSVNSNSFLTIYSGAELYIRDDITLGSGSEIIFSRGAVLIVDDPNAVEYDKLLGYLASGKLQPTMTGDTVEVVYLACSGHGRTYVHIIESGRPLVPVSDLNGDCQVDVSDFAILAGDWLNGVFMVEPNLMAPPASPAPPLEDPMADPEDSNEVEDPNYSEEPNLPWDPNDPNSWLLNMSADQPVQSESFSVAESLTALQEMVVEEVPIELTLEEQIEADESALEDIEELCKMIRQDLAEKKALLQTE